MKFSDLTFGEKVAIKIALIHYKKRTENNVMVEQRDMPNSNYFAGVLMDIEHVLKVFNDLE